jgi:hypothetical protein
LNKDLRGRALRGLNFMPSRLMADMIDSLDGAGHSGRMKQWPLHDQD